MTPLLAVVGLAATQGSYSPHGPRIEVTFSNHKSFVITTDEKKSPRTVKAVLELIKSKFYDGQKVHRVESWVVQWGDPRSKTLPMHDPRLGTKSSGTTLPFESSKAAFMRGIVGIASPYTGVGGDGQLFILIKDTPRLNGGYGILGKVTSGMDVVDHIRLGDRIEKIRIIGNG
jgi:cyclophilin family peptidyl-prolyl cis-trans isomerase